MKRYIRSNEEILKPFMVTFGWDTGGPDTGPRISSGHELVYALSKEDACSKWEADNAESFRPGGDLYVYEGCWAKPVTPEEVEEYEREEYERYAYEDDTIPINSDTDVMLDLNFGEEPVSDKISYRQIYDRVMHKQYDTVYDLVSAIAQLAYRGNYGGYCNLSKDEAVATALDLYEGFTGRWWDPTREQFDDLVNDII